MIYLARCDECKSPVAGLTTRGEPSPPLGWCNRCGRFTDWGWGSLLDGMQPSDFGLLPTNWNNLKNRWNKGWIQPDSFEPPAVAQVQRTA